MKRQTRVEQALRRQLERIDEELLGLRMQEQTIAAKTEALYSLREQIQAEVTSLAEARRKGTHT